MISAPGINEGISALNRQEVRRRLDSAANLWADHNHAGVLVLIKRGYSGIIWLSWTGAEPLMRRARILIRFTRATGHQHPHLEFFVNNYTSLLAAMGVSEAEIPARLQELAPDFFAAPAD